MPGVFMSSEEVRDAAVAGRPRVGAGEQDAPVGVLGAARPHLLAVHDPARRRPARPSCAGWRGREPASGSLKSWHQMCSPRRIGSRNCACCSGVPWAMSVGADHLEPDAREVVGRRVAVLLLLDDPHLVGAETTATERGGPHRHRPPAVVELDEPGPPGGDLLVVVGHARPADRGPEPGRVLLHPGPHLGSKRSLGRRVLLAQSIRGTRARRRVGVDRGHSRPSVRSSSGTHEGERRSLNARKPSTISSPLMLASIAMRS